MTVAVVQAGAVPFDPGACTEKACRLIAEAGSKGAKLVLFPEAFIPGYPKGMNYGLAVGVRTKPGREEFRQYLEAAIDVPGPYTRRLGEAAAAHRVHLVIGVVEREIATCYCTVLFFDANGTLAGKHRKLMPTAMERTIWGCGDGSTLTVIESPFGRIGSVICWENYMPMLRMAMYAKGVTLYCAPTVDDRDTWLPTMRHVALEGRCFVLTACQFIRRDAFPASASFSQACLPDDTLIRGGSAIIGPLGEVLAGPCFHEEAVVTSTLDLESVGRARFDFDVVGHYSRPDVFQLTINEAPMRAVVSRAVSPAQEKQSRATRRSSRSGIRVKH